MTSRDKERFAAKVRRTRGCHLWTASTDRKGYGAFQLGGRTLGAHRVAWVMAHGPIPKGLCVLHSCDTPSCVRIEHLFLGTRADNNLDKARKGRGTRILTQREADLIRRTLAAPLQSQRRVARRFGVSQSLVSQIARGVRYSTN